MNPKLTTILILLFISYLTTSFQCNKCRKGDLHLDGTRSWLPLKGSTSLSFQNNAGSLSNFNLLVVDTAETMFNECGDANKYEYINTTLYLNPNKSDSIFFTLGSGSWLCVNAMSNGNPTISMCDVFGQAKAGTVAKKFSNYQVGSKTYEEVILLLHSQGNADIIDSVTIANHVGIVGFKYSNNQYSLP